MAQPIWHDQPDYYTTATLPRFWNEAHADAEVAAGEGYLGGAALTGATEDAWVISYETRLSSSVEFGFGARVKIDALPGAEKILLGIVATTDASGGVGPLQVCLTSRTDGKVSLWRGEMDTLLATSSFALPIGSHLRLALTGILDRSNGIVEAWLDREPVVRANGVNTAGADPPTWGGLYVGLAPDIFHSHLYAQSGYGDLRPGYVVRVRWPTAAVITAWTPSAGTIPECIDDVDADDDATIITATALDTRYAVEHVAITDARILGTRSRALVRNVSTDHSPSFTPYVRNTDGATDFGLARSIVSGEWRAIDFFHRLSPFTDAPWTGAEITAAAWGGQTDV